MSSYGVLKDDIADYLARGDLASKIPTFVRVAENMIAQDNVRVRDMIRRARAAGNDTRYLPLPINFLEFRRLEFWPDSDRHYSLIQVTPENLQILNMRDTSTSSYNHPQRYSVHREIEFDAPAGTDAELEMIYYKKYDPLVNDADSNWLLLNAYGLYLWGALIQTAPYLLDDPRLVVWQTLYKQTRDMLMEAEQRGRRNQADARVMISEATP